MKTKEANTSSVSRRGIGIGAKLFILSFICIAVSVASAVTALTIGNKRMVNVVLEANVRASMNAILNDISNMEKTSLSLAEIMSEDEALAAAVETGETDNIRAAANNLLKEERANVEFVSVADAQGTVLARTHNDAVGDSIATHRNVAGALSGKNASYIETGTKIKLSLISSAPIKNGDGQIIGTVSLGYQLDKPDFVDKLKEATGADITVFLGDERVNTTIIVDGERQIGTKLNPAVAEIVLGQQRSYYATATILGGEYYAAYEPIITNGEAVGIFFAGAPVSDIRQYENNITFLAIGISMLAAIIALIINRIITQKMIITPVKALTAEAVRLAEGSLSQEGLAVGRTDEIGLLGESVRNVAGVLGSLIYEMETMSQRHDAGETGARVNEQRFSGAYMRVAAGINLMVESYVSHMRDLSGVLSEFVKGDFNAEYAQLPGEKAILNRIIEELRRCLKDINHEIETLAEGALEGRLQVRAEADNFDGDWKALLTGLNAVMDAVIAPINEAAAVLDSMSCGNLSTKMEGAYKGDFQIIKTKLNSTQEAISSYISEISKTLNEMSAQNFDVGIERAYIGDFSIIKDDLNMIINNLNSVLEGFSSSAEQVADGSRHISDSSYNLAQGAAQQTSSVQELNALIEQISQQTHKNTEDAEKASGLAIDVSKHTEDEAKMMNTMLKAMEGINESSANISKIIKVIEDIAFQTNLLALNAAVEAARAGEHGKGFAVVAEEVRNLASRSQSAARDTTALIEGSVEKVSEGVQAANDASEGLNVIVAKISEVSEYVKTIAEASVAQNESIDQISMNISEVSKVTQENNSISQESAAASEELSSQAELFRSTIAKFKLKGK